MSSIDPASELPSRDDTLALMHEYTASESLRAHMLSVEAAMRAYAVRFGEDPERWGLTGLLHDFDYERDPDGHPQHGKPILEQAGVPGTIVHAIQSHGDHTGIPRVTPMEKTLYAVDELCGFVTAVALVRPSKRVAEVEPASVRKKMKDKAFARGVSREDVTQGAAELGVDLDEHIQFVIEAMRPVAESLGLRGTPAAG
jgi:predicted hydrolase (HD superfamily)